MSYSERRQCPIHEEVYPGPRGGNYYLSYDGRRIYCQPEVPVLEIPGEPDFEHDLHSSDSSEESAYDSDYSDYSEYGLRNYPAPLSPRPLGSASPSSSPETFFTLEPDYRGYPRQRGSR